MRFVDNDVAEGKYLIGIDEQDLNTPTPI